MVLKNECNSTSDVHTVPDSLPKTIDTEAVPNVAVSTLPLRHVFSHRNPRRHGGDVQNDYAFRGNVGRYEYDSLRAALLFPVENRHCVEGKAVFLRKRWHAIGVGNLPNEYR